MRGRARQAEPPRREKAGFRPGLRFEGWGGVGAARPACAGPPTRSTQCRPTRRRTGQAGGRECGRSFAVFLSPPPPSHVPAPWRVVPPTRGSPVATCSQAAGRAGAAPGRPRRVGPCSRATGCGTRGMVWRSHCGAVSILETAGTSYKDDRLSSRRHSVRSKSGGTRVRSRNRTSAAQGTRTEGRRPRRDVFCFILWF